MPDYFDAITERELKTDASIHSFRYNMPKGVAGECEECEEQSPRLIGGLCVACRNDTEKHGVYG